MAHPPRGLVLPSPPAVMCHVCVGASGAAGAGQLGCAAEGCCLHGLLRWVHCNLLRASGTGILLLAAGSLLMPQWSTTPIAVLALGAKACNFHRPYRECQLLSMLVTGLLVRQWEPWVGKLLAILWAGCHPLFPQNVAMEVDPPNPVGYPPLPGPKKKNCGPFLGMTCQWRNFCAWIRGAESHLPCSGLLPARRG